MDGTNNEAHEDGNTTVHLHVQDGANACIGDVHYHIDANSTIPTEERMNEIKKRIQKDLKLQAEITAGSDCTTSWNGRPITPVQMQFVENLQQSVDNQNYFQKRRNKINFFEKSQNVDSIVRPDELFERARNAALAKADSSCSSDAAKSDYVCRHGKIVIVTGKVGIGKTTFTKTLMKRIVGGEFLSHTSFLFYIPLRCIQSNQTYTLLDFLFSCCPNTLRDLSDAEKKSLLNILLQDSNLFIMLDGLDEIKFTPQKDYLLGNHKYLDSIDPVIILMNILGGNLFPDSHVIVTSRPGQFSNLHPNHKPLYAVQLCGLNQQSQDDLGKQICQNYDKIKPIIAENPDLHENCIVPYNFTIILQFCDENRDVSHVTMTEVILWFLNTFIRSDHADCTKLELEKLVDLAYEGVLENKFIFTEDDLNKAGLSLNAFITTSVPESRFRVRILRQDKLYYFAHRSWQEFLAAVKMVCFLPDKNFNETFSNFTKPENFGRFENVVKLCFGLCRTSLQDEIKKLFSPSISHFRMKKKLSLMKEFIKKRMKNVVESIHSSISTKPNHYIFEGFDVLPTFFFLCGCLRELGSDEMTVAVAAFAPKSMKLHSILFSSEISDLFYFLQASPSPIVFYEIQGYFVGGALQQLARHVTAINNEHHDKIKIKMIKRRVSLKDGESAAIAPLLSYTPHLRMTSAENITPTDISNLAEVISKRETPMTCLDLTYNKMDDDHVIALSPCVSNVKELLLHCNKITAKGVQAIVGNLTNMEQKMKLSLSHNNELGDDGAKELATSLDKFETLSIECCGITLEGSKHIAMALQKLSDQKLDIVKIGGNEIGNEGMEALSAHLHKMKAFDVSGCGISSTEAIGEKLKDLPESSLDLKLISNCLGNDGIQGILPHLNKLTHLDLIHCSITDVSGLANHLESIKQPIVTLNLSHNEIGDVGAQALSRCLSKVEYLRLMKCGIESHGALDLAMGLKLLSRPMKEIVLDDNVIGDAAVMAFLANIRNVQTLKLWSCDVSPGCDLRMRMCLECLNVEPNRVEISPNREEPMDEDAKELSKRDMQQMQFMITHHPELFSFGSNSTFFSQR